MSEEQQTPLAQGILASSRSRTQFLAGAAAAAAGLGIAPTAAFAGGAPAGGTGGGAPMGGTGAAMPESVQSILNIAATAETLAVTAFYNVHEQVVRGAFNTTGIAVPVNVLVSVVRAILR